MHFVISSDFAAGREVQKSILDEVGRRGYAPDCVFAIKLALEEAMINAIKHGNKFDPDKEVELRLSKIDDAVEISVRDFGSGFDPEHLPDPTDPENLLKASGRGILFMRAFMDEVEWVNHESGGTIVTMRKSSAAE